MSWNRKLWAVEMRSKSCRPDPIIVGEPWHNVRPPAYTGDPLRCLLFTTRQSAEAWCAEKREQSKNYGPDWKYRVVRVLETVEKVK